MLNHPLSGCATDCDQPFCHRFDDLLVNLVDREIAFDQDDAIGFAASDLAILLPNALEKFTVFLLEPILILSRLCCCALIATARASEAGIKGRKEQQREIGLQVAADEAVQLKYTF